MKDVLGSDVQELNFCCGVLEIGEFLYHRVYDDETQADYFDAPKSGTGYYISTFVNSPQCYEAYKRLKNTYDIVFQSEPRRNKNSGREVFIVIYKDKQ